MCSIAPGSEGRDACTRPPHGRLGVPTSNAGSGVRVQQQQQQQRQQQQQQGQGA